MNEQQSNTGTLHELALQARVGNRAALEQLLAHPHLRQVIYKIANDKVGQTNADDIYQEVLICIAQKLSTWQGSADITAWIDRITRNTCVDFFRKTKPTQLLITDTLPEHAAEPDQFHYISAQQMLEITRQTLQEMGAECQRLLHAYILEGWEKKEIMERANLPRSTFHRKWKGCYDSLLQKLQKFCGFPGKTTLDDPSIEQEVYPA